MRENRDYFARPVQSDRTAYGYGHTHLDPVTLRTGRWEAYATALVVFALVMWIAAR